MEARLVQYADVSTSDLIVDAVYEGAAEGHLSAEPLSKLIPGIGNMGGFRASGKGSDKRLVVLYTSGEDKDWPDALDLSTGQFVYFGDNKTPGHELHDHQVETRFCDACSSYYTAVHLSAPRFHPSSFS